MEKASSNQPPVEEKKTIQQLRQETIQISRRTALAFWTEGKVSEFIWYLNKRLEWLKNQIVQEIDVKISTFAGDFQIGLDGLSNTKYGEKYILPTHLRERINQTFRKWCRNNDVTIWSVDIRRCCVVERKRPRFGSFGMFPLQSEQAGIKFSFKVNTSQPFSPDIEINIITPDHVFTDE